MNRGVVVFLCGETEIASGGLSDMPVPPIDAEVVVNAPPFGITSALAGRYVVRSVEYRVNVDPHVTGGAWATVFVTVEAKR